MLTEQKIAYLQEKADKMRCDVIEMLAESKSGHPGGSLSAADIVATLYFHEMKLDDNDPVWPDRDRFVLSKGHAAPILYSALTEKGYYPHEEIFTLRKINSRLQGHPDMKKLPGVDMSTGSLGQGISASVGMALASKLEHKEWRVYALLGDGECQEGLVWEAAMAAAHYKLDNLVAFLDHNGLQIDGDITKVMNPEPLAEKWGAFGWHIINIDGHDIQQIADALDEARNTKGKPTMIVAKTKKGKGVSFMEDKAEWHGVAPKPEEKVKALEELNAKLACLI